MKAGQFGEATFNVENLFDHPKLFMEDNPDAGGKIINEIATFEKEIKKATCDKAKPPNLYKDFSTERWIGESGIAVIG